MCLVGYVTTDPYNCQQMQCRNDHDCYNRWTYSECSFFKKCQCRYSYYQDGSRCLYRSHINGIIAVFVLAPFAFVCFVIGVSFYVRRRRLRERILTNRIVVSQPAVTSSYPNPAYFPPPYTPSPYYPPPTTYNSIASAPPKSFQQY